MRIIWKRYSVGALLLAFLSLLVTGCGDYSARPTGTTTPPATKTIAGFVSNLQTGMPLPGATVTAYAVDANGAQASAPLAGSGFAISGVDGSYSLQIPASYSGNLIVQAAILGSASKPVAKSATKTAAVVLPAGVIRAAVPSTLVSLPAPPPVMLSFASNAVVAFLLKNVTPTAAPTGFTVTGLSSDNIRKATVVFESFFGANFAQVPPPANQDAIATSSVQQQNLLVSIQAFNAVLTAPSAPTLDTIVGNLATTGLGTVATSLTSAISDVIAGGLGDLLPPTYQASPAIISAITASASTPVTVPDLTDTTPPTVPGGLTATAVNSGQVNLSWSASTDAGTGVAGYNVYRSTAGGSFVLVATVGVTTSYSDTSVAPQTSYQYKVSAFDQGHNDSAAGTVASVTTQAASTTPPGSTAYLISGKVTVNGQPLAGVVLNLNGAGTGSAVTAADGSYSFAALNGSYAITPVLANNYQYAPVSKTVTVNGADLSGIDFTATQNGSVGGSVTYPDGSVNGSVTYPDGSVTAVVRYPSGTVIGGVSYPAGTVVTSIRYANGTVVSTVRFPAGAVIGGVTYPGGSVATVTSYPTGEVATHVVFGNGTIVSTVSYVNGSVSITITYPTGSVVTRMSYPDGTVSVNVSYSDNTVGVFLHYTSAR